MPVEINLKPLRNFFENYEDIVVDELAKGIDKEAARVVNDARSFNTPDVTGAQDQAISYAGPYKNKNKGPGYTVVARFYFSEPGDEGSRKKSLYLEYNLGRGDRGQFMTPAVALAVKRTRRILPNVKLKVRRRMARLTAGV